MFKSNSGNGLYTPKKVAEVLGLKEKYVKSLIREGVLPAKKIGKFMRMTQEGLDTFIANLGDSSKGRKRMSDGARNQIKYHAKLRSKDATPKAIQKMSESILKIKEDLGATDDTDRKVPMVAKYKSIVSARLANMGKMEAISGELETLAGQAYPGIRDFVDEDPDALEEIFAQDVQGPQPVEGKAKGLAGKAPKSMTGFFKKQMEAEK